MNIWAVIPTKPFEEGKGRLSGVLGDHERHALNRWFFENTLEAVLAIFPPARVVVVSRSKEARAIAQRHLVHPLTESEHGNLNAALTAASQFARFANAEGVLSLSCDLPELIAEDLQSMLARASSRSVIIARDKTGTGTNALLTVPSELIAFHFGDNSLAAHIKAAECVGQQAVVIDRPGLSFDIDTSADLDAWLAISSWNSDWTRFPPEGEHERSVLG